MGLFGRRGDETQGGVSATALVVQADAPARGGRFGGNPGYIRILVDAGSGPVSVAGKFKLSDDQWLVTGMEVPVTVDPADPESFDIDWKAVPSIEERVAANDPVLADPIGAARKVTEAMKAAGLPEVDPGDADPERFEEALRKADEAPPEQGKQRAVVLIPTIRGRADTEDRRRVSSIEGKCPAVLAVNVPGRPPYAVLDEEFEVPSGQWDVAGGGLPALVSSTDPTDVTVVWEELPSLEAQIGDRISSGIEAAQAQASQMEQHMMDAIQQATAAGPPGSTPPPGEMPGLGALAGMQDVMAANAKLVLQNVKDPAQRKMLIEQYRAAGIQIDEEDTPG